MMNLENGRNAYGKGSWAASLRYHEGVFYVVFSSYSSGKTYIYQTEDIENGPWNKSEINGVLHDTSLLFDDDGRVCAVYGGGDIKIIELTADGTSILSGGLRKTLFSTGTLVGNSPTVNAEGAHIYKIDGMYYVFLIAWPSGGRRTQLCYRSDSLEGVYEGRIVYDGNIGYQNSGVAQGGVVQTPEGGWYGFLFQDHGAVGRVPVLMPVTWEDGWPVFDPEGLAAGDLPLPPSEQERLEPFVVASDEFSYADNADLAKVWQWNHNPDHDGWSVTEREGVLRLTNRYVRDAACPAKHFQKNQISP